MEFKKEIVRNVSSEIKSLFSQNINSLVDIAVNQKLKEEKDKFYEKLNVCQEEFIETKEIGLFRHCGECDYCKQNYLVENKVVNNPSCQTVYLNNLIKKKIKESHLYDNEYLFICTCEPKYMNSNRPNNHILTSNYGRLIHLNHNHNNDIYISSAQNHNIHLNREYFKILNTLDRSNYYSNSYNNSHIINITYSTIMDIYQEYHPKATEIFTIEEKTLKLKNKEIEIKLLEDNYKKKYEELSKKEDELIKKEIKLENDIKVHKEKIKNLFKRENDIKLKETIYSCKTELLKSAMGLNDIISIIPWPEDDDYDLIQTKINEVIHIMNELI